LFGPDDLSVTKRDSNSYENQDMGFTLEVGCCANAHDIDEVMTFMR